MLASIVWKLLFCRTNWHKLSSIKTTQVYYLTVLEVRSQKWVSEGQSQGVSQAALLLEVLEDNLCFLAFSRF